VGVALLMQREMLMHHFVTSFVVPLAAPYFSTLSHRRHDFRKRIIERKICVSFLSTMFV
jgi:hypothetical protein